MVQTKTDMPTISVILPVFNAEIFLKNAVESILEQTFKDFELLIINDGSTDSSLEILSTFNDDRIRLINNEANKGLIYTLNKGIEEAKGKYIARMDADDIATLDRLRLQFEFLEQNPSIVLVGGYAEFIDEHSKPFKIAKVPLTHDEIMQKIFSCNCFIHPSVMFRSLIIKDLGGYHSEALHAEDYDLWLRIIQQYQVANIPNIVLNYRIHPNQISQRKLLLQRKAADHARHNAFEQYKRSNHSINNINAVFPTFWESLSGMVPSVGNDYYSWINIYKLMGRNDLAKPLILPAIFNAPLFIELYLEYLPQNYSNFILKEINFLRWYAKRIHELISNTKCFFKNSYEYNKK